MLMCLEGGINCIVLDSFTRQASYQETTAIAHWIIKLSSFFLL